VFCVVWLVGVVLIGGAIFVGSSVSLIGSPVAASQGSWVGLIVPPFMVAFFVALLSFGRYLARDERDFLLQFLHRIIGAHRV
jgi:hypothetical protein